MVITNNWNKEISDEARTIYEGAHPHIEKGELTYRAAETTYDRFKKSYEARDYGKDYKARKYTAIPGALASFFIEAPVHIFQSAYHLSKSIITGKKDLERSYGKVLKVFRDLEEGVGDLAMLVNDKWGCYLVYDAQYNKRIYGERLYRKEYPEKMKARAEVSREEAMGEFGKLPADLVHEIFAEGGVVTEELSSTLRAQEMATAERLKVYDEERFQELLQELTWAEGYLAYKDLSNASIPKKLQALYQPLRKEMVVLFGKSAVEERPHPAKLMSILRDLDRCLEEENFQRVDGEHRVNLKDIKLGSWGLTRIPKEFIRRNPDLIGFGTRDNPIWFIPKEIGQLQSLKVLELNGQYAYLPDEIGNLQQLETATFLYKLQSLPKTMKNLSSLRFLWISTHKMKSVWDYLPQEFLGRVEVIGDAWQEFKWRESQDV